MPRLRRSCTTRDCDGVASPDWCKLGRQGQFHSTGLRLIAQKRSPVKGGVKVYQWGGVKLYQQPDRHPRYPPASPGFCPPRLSPPACPLGYTAPRGKVMRGSNMTTCRNCKKELTPDDNFCRKCGQVVFADEYLKAAVRPEAKLGGCRSASVEHGLRQKSRPKPRRSRGWF